VTTASYYRRQAEVCLRGSRPADLELALRLVAMAEEYLERAEGLEREPASPGYIAVIQHAARDNRH
jgi:hypothetical protein